MTSTYCYAHGLVEMGCNVCLAEVGVMMRGEGIYRKGITAAEAYSWFFPQVDALGNRP